MSSVWGAYAGVQVDRDAHGAHTPACKWIETLTGRIRRRARGSAHGAYAGVQVDPLTVHTPVRTQHGASGASGAPTMFSGIRAAGRKSEANVGLEDIHAMVRY